MSSVAIKSFSLSSVTKNVCIFSSIILVITLYYFLNYNTIITSYINYIPSTNIGPKQCNFSSIESDGWFCESDSDWELRKVIDRIQNKRNRISDSRHMFFQNNWEPTIHCTFEQRIGNPGDGGKWICDIHRFTQMNMTNLLIYSFGSNGDFSFEKAVNKILPKAEIHTFDIGYFTCPANVCIFHRARLGNGKNGDSKSLQTVMDELGHKSRSIHILKVDIEGGEYDLFEELFNHLSDNQVTFPYIRQILFEIHLSGSIQSEESTRRTHKLFELFRANNYAIFHKEVNLYDAHSVCEFALIRLNPLFFISHR
ncbi:unnamed protein product [Adineta steineri]|uniref:Methyltransferase domain-containing protein n=1 Tax=Adineta steineri TaxID=433720 RepID=A0A814DCX7_9BILA|nr:unnamed protein product [Adineta steineri]